MKKASLIVLFLMLVVQLYSQGHQPVFSPEDTFSFIKIKLTNPDGTPYANSPVVLKGEKGHIVNVTTNKDGRVKAKVPYKEVYSVHCGEHQCMKTIAISDFPYVTYNFQAYTRRFIYFTFTYQNPQGKRLEGEQVVIHSIKTGKKYIDTTNAQGQVQVYLPFEHQFKVSVNYHDNVKMLYPTERGKEYKIMSMTFTWMGAKEKERRARYMDSLARAQYIDVVKLLDSLSKTENPGAIAEMDVFVPIQYDSLEWVMQMLELKAKGYKKQLEKNPKFLEEQQKIVLAPLYRLRKKFKQKIIVTDITGSMYPYMEQVMLWHALNFMDEKGTKYLFFNDGNMMSTKTKVIGQTGGLYFCQGQFKDFKHIIKTMRKGMNGGGGGDTPENDIEALLAAQEHQEPLEELILIADNFSSMRDYDLMTQLGVPIRIVLCGIERSKNEMGSYHASINEEYLNLALETGGSIHTVKEDVYNLAETKEGDTLLIDGKSYDFINGRFILQEKT